MKFLFVTLLALVPSLGFSAPSTKCHMEATVYTLNYLHDSTGQIGEIKAINGSADVPGPGGYVSLGLEVVMPDGKELLVIPMMTPGCRLVDILAFDN